MPLFLKLIYQHISALIDDTWQSTQSFSFKSLLLFLRVVFGDSLLEQLFITPLNQLKLSLPLSLECVSFLSNLKSLLDFLDYSSLGWNPGPMIMNVFLSIAWPRTTERPVQCVNKQVPKGILFRPKSTVGKT